ncbi:16S rRNA (guanine(527)-N(7))-methyltransferase RsmG [Candidatus Nitrosacidococcus sp. I8]|uniref:16S rRNA (guanine(527)-N(7))-methyltransferase RsmG n=1 Tax=Candidatus Nitrosacidococcus sp. I8 TaxID=2942908 RepID=UPI002226637A|nr:16S rRNA (guanine(527)-N(7))-methyltransferase RsmG [Candidatus Nitrosacidococcus sp. I8]CAH9019954.1 Ribosomal RNA small subunit methyltransferase G [Candidatus Nitrosacidococcus sp. I8]
MTKDSNLTNRSLIELGIHSLNLQLKENQIDQLLAYFHLLNKWNQRYNLTAIRSPKEVVSKHLLDSLSVVTYLKSHRVLDVGSGAGLPGIPLAIACSNNEITLLDSCTKKTRFLMQTVIELGLTNVSIVNKRIEHYQPNYLFDTIISRAFSKLIDFARLTSRLRDPSGKLLAMKGVYPKEEIELLPAAYKVRNIYPLSIPRLEAQRHLIELQ